MNTYCPEQRNDIKANQQSNGAVPTAELPEDLVKFIILPYAPLSFFGVSKKWRQYARSILSNYNYAFYSKLINSGLESAAKFGDVDLLKALLTNRASIDHKLIGRLILQAIREEQIDIVKVLLDSFPRENPLFNLLHRQHRKRLERFNVISQAFKCKDRRLLEVLFKPDPSSPSMLLRCAASYNDENVVFTLLDNRVEYGLQQVPSDILECAVYASNTKIFDRLLLEPNVSLILPYCFMTAYGYGYELYIPKIVADPRFEVTQDTICEMLEKFPLHSMAPEPIKQLYIEHNIQPCEDILENIAKHQAGVDFAKLLLDAPGWNKSCGEGLEYAAYNGDIEMVDLLIQYGLYSDQTCEETLHFIADRKPNRRIMIEKIAALHPNLEIHPFAIEALECSSDDVALFYVQHPRVDLAAHSQIYIEKAREKNLEATLHYLEKAISNY